jgi:nucleoside-diphosphate-sugar epimerase
MRVVITGAAGKIAKQLIDELGRLHELRLIDSRTVPGQQSIIADLKCILPVQKGASESGWIKAFKGAHVVVHLAANPQQAASWPELWGDNMEATWNVLEAAAAHRVSRVVFASSNWAVKALEHELAPNCYLPSGPKIGSDAAPCPVNPYGLSKAFGETAGRMFVTQGRLDSFVAVRIGYYASSTVTDQEFAHLWVGSDDLRSLLRQCIEVPFDGFHVVYGVSTQPESPYDLTYTKALLSWAPEQLLGNASAR